MNIAEFSDLDSLIAMFRELGATQLLAKRLSENDNSKQQIYLGGGFASLNWLPYGTVAPQPGLKNPTFHAAVNLHWIDAKGRAEPATHAKLILYPRYPEVRLSGFLQGCNLAPSKNLRPIVAESRKHNNAPDGRVLLFGVAPDKRVYAYLALAGSAIAEDFDRRRMANEFTESGIFWTKPILISAAASRVQLIAKLREIHLAGWHASQRLDSEGRLRAYTARNGGGITLEALLDIRPNSQAAPDFLGWEIKAFGQSRITLMTPEPNLGIYKDKGSAHFIRTYGKYDTDKDRYYFTGSHVVGVRHPVSQQFLRLRGFNDLEGKISDVTGGIELWDHTGKMTAGWSYASLIEHWGRKHAAAAYVPYERNKALNQYLYQSPVYLGEGTDFSKFLMAMAGGFIAYDPGCKIERASTAKPEKKTRNQFRISKRHLDKLYDTFHTVLL